MFTPEVEAIIPAWKAKKDAQWAAINDAMPGLQLMVSGDRATHYMLVCSPHDDSFYEAITFGQLPEVVLETYGSKINPRVRDMKDEKKPFDKRPIDLTDEQIAQVVSGWQKGQSALLLPFIVAVYGADGKPKLRT